MAGEFFNRDVNSVRNEILRRFNWLCDTRHPCMNFPG